MKEQSMSVVMVEPGRMARICEIGTELEDMQRAVMGLIEPVYAFDDPDVCIVCNEEGKINGMPPTRALYDDDGRISDLIFGPFFVCRSDEEGFRSLRTDEMEHYEARFRYPESFLRIDGQLRAVKYEPQTEKERER